MPRPPVAFCKLTAIRDFKLRHVIATKYDSQKLELPWSATRDGVTTEGVSQVDALRKLSRQVGIECTL